MTCDFNSLRNKKTNIYKPAFIDAKALDQHVRIKHGLKAPISGFVDGSGVCPACNTKFVTRLRCLRHLTDARRPTCRDKILAGGWPLVPQHDIQTFEQIDRDARRSARQSGNSHALSVTSATRADGRRVGRVQI